MKKFVLTFCALIPAFSAFAYGYRYDSMSGVEIFTLVVMIAYIFLSIVVLLRWWKMTTNIQEIKEHLKVNHEKSKSPSYLIAIGEREKADKAALVKVVDKLLSIYYDNNNFVKLYSMNSYLEDILPRIENIGIHLPEYVTSGEKFIDYMNKLTGNNIEYEKDWSQNSLMN